MGALGPYSRVYVYNPQNVIYIMGILVLVFLRGKKSDYNPQNVQTFGKFPECTDNFGIFFYIS